MACVADVRLLGAADVRRLAASVNISPTKKWGQNFVIDPNTVRRIVELGNVTSSDVVLEVGPGLGSLSLAILERGARVVSVEIDPELADKLPDTIAEYAPDSLGQFSVVNADALRITTLDYAPTKLIANLPYNISVPVVLHLLETFSSLDEVLVMVQAEVADRLAAKPGNKTYGVPSVKARWYGSVTKVGAVGRNVFWPAPNVDSGLVRITVEHKRLDATELREQVFAIVDSAFGQRRKALRTALGTALGTPQRVEEILHRAGISPMERGEQLTLEEFISIALAAQEVG
ncbi:MAG: 16S rRNA (adenine(1518)-N(6)/adenine(1519)-N(6))-dimethyltransferase RsmA [Actinobacteria bacterium]|nr:16S rRNA (adenine(1518)-N(6)/adenine(1519)-N(6))-dimethyltransferase RsmA [Actinomycetota bacterium]